MVNRGGIKNTSQIKALNTAETKTGKISNVIASKETVSNRINATTLYPRAVDKPKQIADTRITVASEYRYCFSLFNLFNKNSFILHQM